MIFQVLQALIIIAVLLSLVILAALGYSTFNGHMVQKTKNAQALKSGNLLAEETIQHATDKKQIIIRLYWLLRNEFHATLKLPPMTGQTEREILGKIRNLSTNKLAVESFHKVYLVYERVRFGDTSISQHELESFLSDVRSLNASSK
ncbi:MAG: hypothetical protein ABSF09_12770 [Candidatus Bathyarchaeia archaeon]|jgi:hypothetical protein